MLEAKGLSIQRGRRLILSDVNFSARKSKVLVILGPNGAGKTTLLLALSGLLEPQSGSVELEGMPLSALPMHARSQKVALAPQVEDFPFDFSVREIVEMGEMARMIGQKQTTSTNEAVDRAIARLQLEPLAGSAITRVSGGERQRANLARLLVQDPDYFLLDEPTTHLDHQHQSLLVELIQDLSKEGKGVILCTHDLNLAHLIGDEFWWVGGQRVELLGDKMKAFSEDSLRARYGKGLRIGYDADGQPVLGQTT